MACKNNFKKPHIYSTGITEMNNNTPSVIKVQAPSPLTLLANNAEISTEFIVLGAAKLNAGSPYDI